MKPFRVALFGNAESPHIQLWIRAVLELCGEPIVIGAGRVPSDLNCRGVRFVRPAALGRLWGVVQAGWALFRFQPDLLHFHYLGWGSLYAVFTSRPYIVSPWGNDVYRADGLWKSLRRVILRKAIKVTTTSRAMVDALREYGIASDDRRVVTFSWGVDTRVFCPLDPASRRRLRAELGLPQEKIVVVLPRSLLPVYQNLEIVELLAQLPSPIRGRLEICLLSGFGQDDAYRARVEESLRATGISHRILAGPIPREMVAKHLQCCDVAVSAPRVDQRSTTVLECFACVPEVVLLDLPVYREFRTSGYSATFLPTLDPHDAHSQQLVLQAILASVGPGAPGKLQENWGLLHRTESADCFLEAVEALYGKCLDERVRRPA